MATPSIPVSADMSMIDSPIFVFTTTPETPA